MKARNVELADALYARVFKGILLSADVASREETGELVAVSPGVEGAFLGTYADYFSKELRDRAQKMTYVYSLFFFLFREFRSGSRVSAYDGAKGRGLVDVRAR
jgi:hypothetical protein